jgi:hypothetical protein
LYIPKNPEVTEVKGEEEKEGKADAAEDGEDVQEKEI